jgi:DNA-nicking Smr family endonuclease
MSDPLLSVRDLRKHYPITSGVLRREVPQWLNQRELRGRIVSFVEAQPRHGGAGALYVLLRRRRDG